MCASTRHRPVSRIRGINELHTRVVVVDTSGFKDRTEMPIPRANPLSGRSNLLLPTAIDQMGRGKMPPLSSCGENSRPKVLNVVVNSSAVPPRTRVSMFRP